MGKKPVGKTREADLPYQVALWSVPGLGGVAYRRLLARFSTAKQVWHAKTRDLSSCGLTRGQLTGLLRSRRVVAPQKMMEKLEKQRISIYKRGERGYPPLLAEMENGPPLMFVKVGPKWKLDWTRPVVAVVGSRKPTRYGLEVVEELVAGLAAAGVTVVSGLAYGIDSQAHRACLEGGGVTLAVLPGGAGVVMPAGNRGLARQIVEDGGGLMWEFGGRVAINRSSFPIRNRLVAGMSQAVIVVEGEERSGSMITPKLAADYGREVLAVPGPVTSSRSAGPNNLIKQGAKLVTGVADILEEVRGWGGDGEDFNPARVAEMTDEERQVWSAYEKWGRQVDKLASKSGVKVEAVLRYLTEWELTGRV